jgi:hypothetical protein
VVVVEVVVECLPHLLEDQQDQKEHLLKLVVRLVQHQQVEKEHHLQHQKLKQNNIISHK